MKEQRQKIGKKILTWYLENKRDLPWRHTSDPYRIWISEIMLQQTRVDTAIDYYQRFLSRFPDVGTLASADEAEILSCWKGLGYYSRARNLHKAAKIIFEKYKGIFPQDFETLKALPGIGPYSAGAVLSIAFNIPYPAVDGNVLRVISRLIASMEDIGKESTRKKIADVVHQMMPEGNAGNFNQGLMDMGSMVCLPQNPGCPHCPVHLLCSTYEKGLQEEIPVRKKKAGPTPEILCRLAVVEGKEGILLEYRREETLLSRLWGFPMVEKTVDISPENLFAEKYRLELKEMEHIGTAAHVFSHRIWKMEVVRYTVQDLIPKASNLRWFHKDELKQLAIPTAFQKVLDMVWKDLPLVAEEEGVYDG